MNGAAALYVVHANEIGVPPENSTKLLSLLHVLASRADAHYVAVVDTEKVAIYPVSFTLDPPASVREVDLQDRHSTIDILDFLMGASPDSFSRRSNAGIDSDLWLDKLLLRLLSSAAYELGKYIPPSDCLSLVGRALFMRFLIDRTIVTEDDLDVIAPEATNLRDLLASAESCISTFRWLDRTFNGELLQLNADDYEGFFNDLGDKVRDACTVLSNIMYSSVHGQLEIMWEKIRFEHVPADVLSQVYQDMAQKYDPQRVKKQSIQFTPRHIAQQIVDGAFNALPDTISKSKARVLDPAAGAGVFLVLAFRRLVQEDWTITGRRPKRKRIRGILENQLCGFEINQESLKFAALSLYLTALELDPEPEPLSELRFENLGKLGVLINVDSYIPTERDDYVLGSLSTYMAEAFTGKFEIVLGNPPWTAYERDRSKLLTNVVREVGRLRGWKDEDVHQYDVPDATPDIPFVYRAMQWAIEGGAIAFILHGRLLTRMKNGGIDRWRLFSSLRVTTILNGADFRTKPDIWGGQAAPFCILIARNKVPAPNDAFYYYSPIYERGLGKQGRFRLDPHSAAVLRVRHTEVPHLFISLRKGSWFDVDFISRVQQLGYPNLAEYWAYHGLKHGRGFIVAGPVTEGHRRKKPMGDLSRLHVLHSDNSILYFANPEDLPKCRVLEAEHPREEVIYRAPLVALRLSLRVSERERGGILAYQDILYTQSFIGFSAKGFKAGSPKQLADYLFVVARSRFFMYFCSMIGSRLLAERPQWQKEDFERFPIVPFESLTEKQLSSVQALKKEILSDKQPFQQIDDFVADLYGFADEDRQLIDDFVNYMLPIKKVDDRAAEPPTQRAIDEFARDLVETLDPFYRKCGEEASWRQLPNMNSTRWRYLLMQIIRTDESTATKSVADPNYDQLVKIVAERLATDAAVSQIVIRSTPSNIVIGQLAQMRYWTRTRARAMALKLIQEPRQSD